MAKDVKFNVQINVNGKENVVTTTTDIKTFAAEFAKAKSEVENASRSFANMADILITVQSSLAALRKVTDVLADMSAAYNTQIEAETRLATVMRQRMDATDEDIQAMKDLASAQQELGVVGDEVQLAALQQVATFATERSTLETLLPAMNNLLVQQRGLNATQSDAISIANKAGKALMGQTGELREAGITFTDAQEQVMKFGTEQERAAMFAQVVTENVGNMNAELAKTDGGKAKQAADWIGDLKEQVGATYASIQPFITSFASFGTAVTSAMNVFQGIKTVLVSYTSTANSASTATNILRVSLTRLTAATGVGIAIYALSGLLESLSGNAETSVEKLESLESAENSFRSAAAQAKVEMESQIASLKKLIEENADTSESVRTLNEKYGKAFGTHKTAAEWYDTLVAKSRAYCMQLGYEAKAKELARQIADRQIAADMNDKEMERMRNDGSEYEEKFRPYCDANNNLTWGYLKFETEAYRQAKKNAESYRNEIAELERQMELAVKGIEEYSVQLSATPSATEDDTTEDDTVTEVKTYVPEGSLKDIQERISGLKAEFDISVSQESRNEISRQIKVLEDERHLIELELKYPEPPGLPEKYNGISVEMPDIAKTIPQIEKAGKDTEKMKRQFEAATGAASDLGASIAGLGSTLELPVLNVMGVLAQAIATLVQGYAEATVAAGKMNPLAWLAFTATGLAQLTSVVGAVKNMTAFAEGGIVSGPTMALVGEYAGASNNPEVIAPLNRLRSLIQPAGTGGMEGKVEFVIKGKRLVGVLERTALQSARS